jgi:signal transduction histidine kinase
MKHLFKPFTRGATHGEPGMGLGLSIAAQAANFLGGRVKVESKLGEGSTFALVLPKQPGGDAAR